MSDRYVKFPKHLIAIWHPGYFFHTEELRLYTMKVTGVLRPLYRQSPNNWNKGYAGYNISVKGRKQFIREENLIKLAQKPRVSKIPMQEI